METGEGDSDESEQTEQHLFHISVDHTDNMQGVPDFEEYTLQAKNEQKAIELAKNRPTWPDPQHYDDDDISAQRQ